MTGLPPAAVKTQGRSRFTALFYSALREPNATDLTFIYIDILFFFTFAICHLCFTRIEMSHCCSSPLQSVYLAILLAIAWGGESVCVCVLRIFTSSYLLVSAVVMAMSGGVRSGSVVGRGGTVTASDSGLRSQ